MAAASTFLSSPRSIAPLAAFRVVFGAVLFFSTLRFVALGWVDDHYLAPRVHFPYFGFEWVTVLPPFWMYALHAAMALSALGIAAGYCYRTSAAVFFLTFTYTELIDVTYYLNHYYFVSLIAFLLIFVPADRAFSLRILKNPGDFRAMVPAWTVLLLQFQVGLVYVMAGIAKLRPEWLFEALPLRIWLPAHAHIPVLGALFAHPWTPWIFSWAGLLFDLFIVYFYLQPRFRAVAWGLALLFHGLTGLLFQIGVFPLVMSGAAVIFFDGPLLRRLTRTGPEVPAPLFPALRPAGAAALGLWVAFQVLFPFRYLLYPGSLLWTEQGYRFGWRVMLMEKAATAHFSVENPETGVFQPVDNRVFLNAHQEKQMAFQPDMLLHYAHYLADTYQMPGHRRPRVRAEVHVMLNGAPGRLLFDPRLDLTSRSDSFAHKNWLYPHRPAVGGW